MLIPVKRLEGAVTITKDWSDFRAFAIKWHGDQMYGKYPYAYHLAQVEHVLVEFGFTSHNYRAAAWLHDIIEDTKVTLETVTGLYGLAVAGMVLSCTGVGKNRKERNESIYKKLALHPEAAPVKIADRLVNVNSCLKARDKGIEHKLDMYLKEWPAFKAAVEPLVVDNSNAYIMFDTLNEIMETEKKRQEQEKTGQG